MFSCFCHIALYTCSTIDSLLSDSINARMGKRLFVPNGNDDDVIINYITDMDLGEDSDSLNPTQDFWQKWGVGAYSTWVIQR